MSRVDQQFAMGGLSFLSSAKVTTLLRDESQQMLMMVCDLSPLCDFLLTQ